MRRGLFGKRTEKGQHCSGMMLKEWIFHIAGMNLYTIEMS